MITSGRLQEGRRRNDAKEDTQSSIKIDTSTLIMRQETLVTCLRRLRSLRTHIPEERRFFSSCRYRRSIVSCNCENGSWLFVISSKVALPKNAIPRYPISLWLRVRRFRPNLRWTQILGRVPVASSQQDWQKSLAWIWADREMGSDCFRDNGVQRKCYISSHSWVQVHSTTKHFCSSRLLRERFLMRKPFEWKRPVIWRPLVFISYLESQQKQVRATYRARTQKLVLIYAWKIVNSGFFESCAHHSDEKDRNLINFNEWDVLCDKKRKQKTFACSISHLTRW